MLKKFLVFTFFTLSIGANSATLTHSYLFGGDYSDSTGSTTIINTGGSLSGGRYFFGNADGLTLTGALTDTGSYSIEMVMSTTVVASGYDKLIDFQNFASDNGLYLLNNNLVFYSVASGATPVSPDTDFSVVLTVDSGVTSGYLNGDLQWFSASADSVPASNILNFFLDDSVTGGTEADPGSIDYLRIYDGALTSEEVGDLVSPVPIPAAAWLFGSALLGLGMVKRRKA